VRLKGMAGITQTIRFNQDDAREEEQEFRRLIENYTSI